MTRLPISTQVHQDMTSASWIRAMFEVGQKMKAELGEANVFDFSLGNPNASPPSEFFDAVQACAAERNPVNHRYMTNAGYPEARAAVARFLNTQYQLTGAPPDAGPQFKDPKPKIQFEPHHVLLTSGAAGGMNVVMRAILDPGDEVLVLSPYFVEYRFYLQHAQGRIVLVETDDEFQPVVERIEAAITDRTRAVILNSPNNPTGAVYSLAVCRAVADMLRRHDRPDRPIYLICDDIYRRLVYDTERCPAAADYYPRTIVTSSFSKDLSIPGERAGYVALRPDLPEAGTLMTALVMLNRTMGFVNMSAFMQRVITRCVDTLCDIPFYRRNRDRLCSALQGSDTSFRCRVAHFMRSLAAPSPTTSVSVICSSPNESWRCREPGLAALGTSGCRMPLIFRRWRGASRASSERSKPHGKVESVEGTVEKKQRPS